MTGERISLDALMAESLAESSARQAVQSHRQNLAKGAIPAAERADIEAKVREWEAKREWITEAHVVMFSRQRCKCCGGFSVQFMGWYDRQRSRVSKIDRWVQGLPPRDAIFPRESKYKDSEAELCETCAEGLGYEVEE